MIRKMYASAALVLALLPAAAPGQSYVPIVHRAPAPTDMSVPVKTALATPAAAPAQAATQVLATAAPPKAPSRWRRRDAQGPVAMPPSAALLMLLRSTLAGVNQANFTGDYGVLYSLTTPEFQKRVTLWRLGFALSDLRKHEIDLSPALALDPVFSAAPALSNDVLHVAGAFPSRPLQIRFDVAYRAVEGYWLIESLAVSAVPVAPPPPPVTVHATPAVAVGLWKASVHRLVFGPSVRLAADVPE